MDSSWRQRPDGPSVRSIPPRAGSLPPTVLAGVSNDMRVAQEEVFGPVARAVPFDTVEDAIRLGNQTS